MIFSLGLGGGQQECSQLMVGSFTCQFDKYQIINSNISYALALDRDLTIELKNRLQLKFRYNTSEEASDAGQKLQLIVAQYQERHLQLQYAQQYQEQHRLENTEIPEPKFDGYRVTKGLPLTKTLVVPADLTDDAANKIASFRECSQVPRVVYKHPHTGAVLVRSGQPLVGGGQKLRRCIEDELLVSTLLKSPGKSQLPVIIEARTKQQAQQSKQRGGGSESDGPHYSGCHTYFTQIDSALSIRDYYNRLLDCAMYEHCTASNWTQAQGQWLGQVQACLRPAYIMARFISIDGVSAMAHCDNGIELTSVVVSLTKIMTDPYFRTIEGFKQLIQQDWIDSGFPFGILEARASSNVKDSARSMATQVLQDTATAFNSTLSQMQNMAIGQENDLSRRGSASSVDARPTLDYSVSRVGVFALFLDCVHQIWLQYPTEFEYNLDVLILLHECSLGNCPFGDFLAQHPQEYEQKEVAATTASVWNFVKYYQTNFSNDVYEPAIPLSDRCPPLPVSMHSARLKFFGQMFDVQKNSSLLQLLLDPSFFDMKVAPQVAKQEDDVFERLAEVRAQLTASQQRVKLLQDQVNQLPKQQLDHPLQV